MNGQYSDSQSPSRIVPSALANRRRLLARARGGARTHADAPKRGKTENQRLLACTCWYEIDEFAKEAGSRMKLLRLALLLLAVAGAAGQRDGDALYGGQNIADAVAQGIDTSSPDQLPVRISIAGSTEPGWDPVEERRAEMAAAGCVDCGGVRRLLFLSRPANCC